MGQIIQRLLVLSFLVLVMMDVIGGDSVRANMRLPGAVIVSTRSSSAMAYAEQPTLYCGNTNGQVVGCWNKEKYDEWARNQGQAERSQSYTSSYDGQRIVVDQSQLDYQPTIYLQAGDGRTPGDDNAPKKKKINLEYKVTLKDPKTQQPLQVDNRMTMGNTFAKDTLKQIMAAAPAVLDFMDRQKQMEQTRERFQQQLEAAHRHSENQVNALRQESQDIAQQAENEMGMGLANLGAGLLSSNALMSPEQIKAAEKVRKLQGSDLRFSRYQMNTEGYAVLNKALELKLHEGRWSEIPAIVEALNYAEVSGLKPSSKTLKSLVSPEGIIHAESFFDEKKFKTSFKSENGQIVRRIVNRYQAIWKESESLKYLSSQERAQFFIGSLAASLGDEVIASGDMVRGSGFLKMAQRVADGLQGFTAGLSDSLVELAKSIPELGKMAGKGLVALATDPVGAWEATAEFVSNLGEVKGAIINALNKDFEKLKSGSAFDKGYVIGKYAIDIATLVVSGGAGTAVKSVTTTGTVASALGKVKFAERVFTLIPDSAVPAFGNSVRKAAETIEKMPTAMRKGLGFSASKQPDVAASIAQHYHLALASGDTAAATYLQRVAASKQALSGSVEVREVMNFHASLSDKIKHAPKVSKDSVFSRAIARQYTDNVTGQVVKTNKGQVFNKELVQLTNDHRYTIGGELGHSGIYISEGGIAQTTELLVKETGRKTASELWFAEQRMQLNGLLNLTDPNTVKMLGIKESVLFSDNYNFTHVIGDAAKNNGFQGIIFNSVKDRSKVNLVLFN